MDKYDIAIKFLQEHPERLKESWFHTVPETQCLFQYITIDGQKAKSIPDPMDEFSMEETGMLHSAGLTEIHNKDLDFYPICNGVLDEDLCDMIGEDNRIPNGLLTLKMEDLPVFAEWQRKIDARWGRFGVEKLSKENGGFYPEERIISEEESDFESEFFE